MAAAPIPQPVIVTNAIDVNGIAAPVHTVIDAPLPLPVVQSRPVEFQVISIPNAAAPSPETWLTNQLNPLGVQRWRVVGFAQIPGTNGTVILQRDL